MKYRVYSDSDHRGMDTSARTLLGEYPTYEEAAACAREIVDGVLETAYEPGMSAATLLKAYARRGEDPFILPDDMNSPFDAHEYAGERCAAICGSR